MAMNILDKQWRWSYQLVSTCTQEYNLGVAQWFPANCLGYDTGFSGGHFDNFERLQVPASIASDVKKKKKQ